MAGGLTLMFSGTLWSRVVVVHPGTLTASLLLGTVLNLLWWVDTRRPGVLERLIARPDGHGGCERPADIDHLHCFHTPYHA